MKIWVRSREVPCHLSKKVCHHVRLERNSRFSLIQSSRCGLEEANVIILLRNVQPGRTTLHACARLPMRDNNSRFLAAFLDIHSLTMILILANLSSANHVDGVKHDSQEYYNRPRAFNLWEIPRILQVAMRRSRFFLHCSDWGSPNVRKSSM